MTITINFDHTSFEYIKNGTNVSKKTDMGTLLVMANSLYCRGWSMSQTIERDAHGSDHVKMVIFSK